MTRFYALVFSAILALTLSACGPGFRTSNMTIDSQNNTGFKTPDGRSHTGAGNDQALSGVKAELTGDAGTDISALSNADRALAARLYSAGLVASKSVIRVYIYIRDAGKISFDFDPSGVAPKAEKDLPTDVRYKAIVGKNESGDTVPFEAAMICRPHKAEDARPAREGCRVATLLVRELSGKEGKAGLVIRSQETLVLSKAAVAPKHEVLKRLFENYKVARPGAMQSFEVAWGPSGFALNMGDDQICPVGRLVETNDVDEPLKLNCPGVPEPRDLDGRMIGNTTHGEVFLELGATIPGKLFWDDSTERIFILVRQKREPKKPATPTTTPPPTNTSPNAGTAPTPPAASDTDEEENEDDTAPMFEDEKSPTVDARPSVQPTTNGKSWIMNLDFNNPITRKWAADRKDPAIARGVAKWVKDNRLKEFAVHFIPNRDLVARKLAESRIPTEFAFLTLGESAFFIQDGYPIQSPGKSTALGPWQFLTDTATGNGLRVYPKRHAGKNLIWNPCDERADLAKSSAAAGRYLRTISDMFPYDPKLVILGYNQGEYGVQKKLKKLQGSQARLTVVKELGLNFWAIRRFNMFPMGAINYVQNFVSIYHAALELKQDDVKMRSIAPWRPTNQCR